MTASGKMETALLDLCCYSLDYTFPAPRQEGMYLPAYAPSKLQLVPVYRTWYAPSPHFLSLKLGALQKKNPSTASLGREHPPSTQVSRRMYAFQLHSRFDVVHLVSPSRPSLIAQARLA